MSALFFGGGGGECLQLVACVCVHLNATYLYIAVLWTICVLCLCVCTSLYMHERSLSLSPQQGRGFEPPQEIKHAHPETRALKLCVIHIPLLLRPQLASFLKFLGVHLEFVSMRVCVCCGLNVQLWPLWVNLNLPLSYLPTPTVDFKVNNLNSLSNRGISSSITNKSKFEL